MKTIKVKDQLSNFFMEILFKEGFILVDIEFINKEHIIFYLDYINGGIDLNGCEKASRIISNNIVEFDAFYDDCIIEVSSPGLDKQIPNKEEHLKRYLNKFLRLTLYKKVNGKKIFEGKFLEFNSECIQIEVEKKEIISIEREHVSSIKNIIKI